MLGRERAVWVLALALFLACPVPTKSLLRASVLWSWKWPCQLWHSLKLAQKGGTGNPLEQVPQRADRSKGHI